MYTYRFPPPCPVAYAAFMIPYPSPYPGLTFRLSNLAANSLFVRKPSYISFGTRAPRVIPRLTTGILRSPSALRF